MTSPESVGKCFIMKDGWAKGLVLTVESYDAAKLTSHVRLALCDKRATITNAEATQWGWKEVK